MTKRAFIESWLFHLILLLLASISFFKDTRSPLDRAIFVELKGEENYALPASKKTISKGQGESNLEIKEQLILSEKKESKETSLSSDNTPQKEDKGESFGEPSAPSSGGDISSFEGQSSPTGGTAIGGSSSGIPYASGAEYSSIRSDIERHITYPEIARRRGLEGTVLAGFIIDQKGMPTEIKIIKSSNYEVLDKEVIKIIKRASPYRVKNIKVEVPISFRLKD